jgi:acetolactate decarboxylase
MATRVGIISLSIDSAFTAVLLIQTAIQGSSIHGHLLQCSGRDLRLQIQREGDYHIALPETADFLKADLRRDPTADLTRAEGERK